jgi:hypothetical protein
MKRIKKIVVFLSPENWKTTAKGGSTELKAFSL